MQFSMSVQDFLNKYFPSPWKVCWKCERCWWVAIAKRTVEIEDQVFPLTAEVVVQSGGNDLGWITLLGLSVWEKLSKGSFEFIVDARSVEEEPNEKEGILPLGRLWPVVETAYVPSPDKPLFTSLIGDDEATNWFSLWKDLAKSDNVKGSKVGYAVGLGVIACEVTLNKGGEDITLAYEKDYGNIRVWRKGEKAPSVIITASGEEMVKALLKNPSEFISSQTGQ